MLRCWLLTSGLLTSVPSPFVSVNPFHARHEQEKLGCTKGRSGRPTKRPGEIGQDLVATELSAQETKVHRPRQGIEEMSLKRFCRKTKKTKSYVKRQNNETIGTKSALLSWLPTGGMSLFCLCEPFLCKSCPGKGQIYHGLGKIGCQ